MTARPRNVSPLSWGWGRSCTADAAAVPRPLDDQGYDWEWLKPFEPMFELEHRQAAPQLSPRATDVLRRLGGGGAARCRGLWHTRAVPWRDHQCRLAPHGSGVHVCHRLPLLLQVSRR